jgi:hypothetical protein
MHIVEDSEDHVGTSDQEAAPVVIERWAEAVVDLQRERSRRRHPSNPEPAWHKDGGDEPSEWVI